MNNKLRGILLLLVGFALIGIGIVAVYLLSRQGSLNLFNPSLSVQPTTIPEAKNKAVVLARDMKLGEVIKAGDLTTIDVPVNLAPRDSISVPNDAVGKYIKADLVQGEMLTQHQLADPTNVNQDLAFALSEDHVMMAISVDDDMTKQAIIQRGDIVDIFVTINEQVDSTPKEAPLAAPTPMATPNTPVGTTGTTNTNGETTKRSFTFDGFQKVGVTAMVMDVITNNNQTNTVRNAAKAVDNADQPDNQRNLIKAYLLALKPQDALILKHLKDNGAIFDIVLRAPTSTGVFDLTPVTQEYIVELYGLQILK